MKAVVMTEELKLEQRADYSSPVPDGWAVVDVKAAGVCGSELHFLDGMVPAPFPDFVLGHEIAGVVASAPEGAKVKAGERVAVYNFVGCGECQWCRTGHESICTDMATKVSADDDGSTPSSSR